MNRRRKELAVSTIYADLQQQALRMRQEPTPAEARLWQELRSGRVQGLRFRRQHPVGRFIVDFYCVSAGLVVEVDGSIHDAQPAADQERDEYLTSMGLKVLRFTNDEVMTQIAAVVSAIRHAAEDRL